MTQDRNKNRPGYKKTKVGWIPEEWSCQQLSALAKVQNGISKSSSRELKNPIDVPYLRVANVQDGHLDLRDVKKIRIEKGDMLRYGLRRGDVLFTEGGDYDKLGRGTIWREEIANCVHQNHIFAVRPENGTLMSYFLAAVAAGPAGRKYFLLASKQSTNLASVNSTQLKAFPIPLPTLPEQRKIAEILSTWDTAIEQTRNLIDAKKHRKKGLMQQLLTGKTRLPKFKTQKCTNEHESEIGWENKISHGWREARLNDIFSRVRRKVGERTDVEPLSITSTTGFVSQQKKFSRVIAGKQLKNYILLKKGEFAYNKGNSKSYPQGCIYRLNKYEKAAIPDVFYCFRPASGEIVPEFFEFYFENGMLNHQLSRLINSGVRNDGLLNLNAETFFSIKVWFPGPSEQRAIANVLQTADNEIKLLERKLTALEKQKRGLMQKLLTGEVRVLHPEEQD